jgi:anti-sigma regulatory factor (Ser/Thr protein kinase)
MSTVALRFQPTAEHVRTARLIAVAVARRAGIDEDRLDEVRLAVGEVCARAVRRCQMTGVEAGVLVEMDDHGPVLEVVVTDQAAFEGEEEPVALALVRGLADTMTVEDGPGGAGGLLRMSWMLAG